MTSIYDFGLPLVIGSFFLIGLFLLCRIAVPDAFSKYLDHDKCSNKFLFCYLVVLGFSIGLLFEFVSDKISSKYPVIESEEAIRTESLFVKRNLRLKMSKHGVISASLEDTSRKKRAQQLEQWFLTPPCQSPTECVPTFLKPGDLTDFAMCAYYACKAAVYQDPQYFSELMRIQDKIYFSRSMAVISVVAVCLALLCALLYPALRVIPYIEVDSKYAKSKIVLRPAGSFYGLLILFFLLHLLIFTVSRYSYADYESSSARRFYNYYISKLEFPKKGNQPESQ